ncbi:MAG: hypothetical protein ACRD0C_15600 [Acidimicrobiia bacterium]
MVARAVFVDWNRIGSSASFRVPLSRQEGEGLQVGDVVALRGDPDMPDPQATVKELSPDGYAVLELVAASGRAGAS